MWCLVNTIQYNTIQYNTIQYNTIQYNTIQTLLTLPEEGWSGWVGDWKIRFDEGLTLEKSALESLYVAKLTHQLS